MKFRGREIDAVALWGNYVNFPPNMPFGEQYLPLVKCPNPNHDTQKRHFQINTRDGLVHCFAQCGISGTFVHAISMIEGCKERDAQKIILGHKLLHSSHAATNRKQNKADSEIPSIPAYKTHLPAVALDYLGQRGINEKSISLWGIGWDDDEMRIVIPAKDEKDEIRFLIQRAVKSSQHPKYLYAPEGVHKNRLLFGGCHIDRRMIRSQGLLLVEGSFDAIRLHQHNFRNAVATLGTGISQAQCAIATRLRPRAIFTMFDKDTAGIAGIEIVGRRLGRYPIFVCRYPKGKSDPAELSRREVDRAISRAIPISKLLRTMQVKA